MVENDIGETAFIIADRDISIVQGSTEMFYLTDYFADIAETHVFAPTSQEMGDARMHSLPFAGAIGTILLNILFVPYWLLQLFYHKPDIVYCYQNVLTPPLLAKYVFGATVIYDLQSDPCEQAREFSAGSTSRLMWLLFAISEQAHSAVLPRSDLIVTLSEELEATVIENYGISPSKTHLLPLGVDTDKFDCERTTGNPLVFTYVGSVHARRGIAEFATGLLQVSEENRNQVEFHIYGDGDREHINHLREMCDAAGFDGFQYHGRVPHDQIPRALQKADVAVSPLPELEAYEVSSPAKIYEYLAAGLPIIATSITPHRRILDDDCAFFVEPTAEQYAATIEDIVDNRDHLTDKSAAARETARYHDWSNRFAELSERIASIDAS